MITELKNRLIEKKLSHEEADRLNHLPISLNSAGVDPWGLDPRLIKTLLSGTKWLYTDYFKVKTHGIENIPKGRVLLIANHGGQIPLDGLLIGMSLLLEANPARIARGMVERWVPYLPFIGSLFLKCGQMVGDHHNCRDLLENDQCVLVFPEGVRGSGKSYFKRYQLQRFGTGFIRLALETRTPIVPVGVVGCEETYPALFNFKPLARLFKIPYVPITPFFPLLGPLGMIPLPSRVTIRFGKPLHFETDANAPDSQIEELVEKVKESMRREIQTGLKTEEEKLMKKSSKRSILITGAAGGLANILVDRLAKKFNLVGVDVREHPHVENFPGTFYRVEYTHRKMADVFRKHSFHALLHLGRIRTTAEYNKHQRYNLNVLGTRNLLNLVRQYGVKHSIVFSTFHVYGAYPLNHLYIKEDEPLRASQIFPELSDAIELDHFAKTFSIQYREVRTLILRPVNVIGAKINNEISRVLRAKYCPALLGFNPMLQFIHEDDIARAIELCLSSDLSGVYNVAGEGMISYTNAIKAAGSKPVYFPHFLAYPLVGGLQKLGLRFPTHLMDYFRYSTIVSDEAFRKDLGYQPKMTTIEALQSLRTSE